MKTMKILADSVAVTWPDGTVSNLPHLWSRDNCACNDCRVEQTTEKKFHLVSVPVDLRPEHAFLQDDELHLRWPDGHNTIYSGADIRKLNVDETYQWQKWDSNFQPQRTDFSSFLNDDQTAASMIKDFLISGASILTNAPTVADTLEQLAPRLGPLREVLFERIHNVEVYPDGYNVAHTSLAIPPHNDFASYSWPPSVQALHMLANEVPAGQSIIVDGWAVLSGLREEQPEMFDSLCTMPVPFREFDEDNETFAVMPLVSCGTEGQISAFRYSNQLMQAINPDRSGVVEFYRAYHELSKRIMDESARVTFRLEGGQVLLLASHRVLHAREAFEATGRRHLQDAYFEHDNVRNHLVVLNRKAGRQHE